MGRQRDKREEIVGTLRQAEVLHGQGLSMAEAIRPRGISEVTCARWRKAWGGMSGDQLRRLKELEKDHERLRRTVSDLTLDTQILSEGIAKLRLTAVSDPQHGGFTAGSSPVSWGSIDELCVNLTANPRALSSRNIAKKLGRRLRSCW